MGTYLRDFASFEPLRVKIHPGDWEEIKLKSHTKSYISPPCPEVPRERIFTKFWRNTPFVDIIKADELCVNLFKGLDFTGVKVSIFPIGNWRRRYNSAALLLVVMSTVK